MGAMPNGRTPYEDHKAMLVCFHEAGHVVVTHVVGFDLVWAKAGRGINRVLHEDVYAPDPSLTTHPGDQRARTELLRRVMTTIAAGHVAATIHQKAVEKAGFSCGMHSRAYQTYWELRPSWVYRSDRQDDPASGYYKLVRAAGSIALATAFRTIRLPVVSNPTARQMERYQKAFDRRMGKTYEEVVPKELAAAEHRAERIIKKHWAAVEAVALALHKSKSGHLGRARLLAILDRHGVPSST